MTCSAIDESQLDLMAQALSEQAYCVFDDIIDKTLITALREQLISQQQTLRPAAVGRADQTQQAATIRNDSIAWIDGASAAEQDYLAWMASLQQGLNRRLYLGLFSSESHFAHYPPGHYYQRHKDAFVGEANRIVSVVLYLNQNWSECDGGELVIYRDDEDALGQKILPMAGRVVVFLSEDIPHEVLASKQDRYSIAAWFRLNSSSGSRIDPPR